MTSFLESFRGETYALFRMVAGFLFLCHGTTKLFSYPTPPGGKLTDLMYYGAGPIELVGGFLIMIGLLTHYSAFLASGLMAFAYWMAHGGAELLPIQNKGELAALYSFAFLCIATRGGGMWSVDNLIFGKSKSADSTRSD